MQTFTQKMKTEIRENNFWTYNIIPLSWISSTRYKHGLLRNSFYFIKYILATPVILATISWCIASWWRTINPNLIRQEYWITNAKPSVNQHGEDSCRRHHVFQYGGHSCEIEVSQRKIVFWLLRDSLLVAECHQRSSATMALISLVHETTF